MYTTQLSSDRPGQLNSQQNYSESQALFNSQHMSDIEVVRDVQRGPMQQGGKQASFQLKGTPSSKQRGSTYRKLWNHVKSVQRGDGGKLPSEMSVEEMVRVCCSLPPDASAVSAVSAALVYMDSRAVAALLKELAKKRQLPRAMELFEWLKSLPADHELYSLVDTYTFTTAISLMGPSQQLRRALELVGEMRARGLPGNVHTFSALMNVCIKCDACDLALDVFKQMQEDGIKPNVVTYNTLVDVYGKTGQWEKAVEVLDSMRQENLEPEVRTFNTAIIACNMSGQPQEALKVYHKLLDAGLQPIGTTYTALISAYGKAGDVDKALETLDIMTQAGFERNVLTYSAIISACEKAGRWQTALDLFDQMLREDCIPNTGTYNSIITACHQGGQASRAGEVFGHLKFSGLRPDAHTYSALITAHNKSGDTYKAIKTFEQMQQHYKPDGHVYQDMIDCLWKTGVAWAQVRAWQLYLIAARSWQYRFVVQQGGSNSSSSSSNNSPRDAEFVVPASTPGVAVLVLRKWLMELTDRTEADGPLLGPGCERVVISLGRSKHAKDPSSSGSAEALLAVLAGFNSPFISCCPAEGEASNAVAEAGALAFASWVCSPELRELLALLVPHPAGAGRQPSPLGPNSKRISFAADMSEDSKLKDSCLRAFDTVLEFERGQLLQPGSMAAEYVAERKGLIQTAFQLAEQLDLAEEVVFDAVLLMDRTMSTGAEHDSSIGSLFVAASLQLAALQTVSGADEQALSSIPSDDVLSAAVNYPAGSVNKMKDNIKAALFSDTKCISMMRTVKLYLERMGADGKQEAPAAAHFLSGMFRLLRTVLLDHTLLVWRPTTVALAALVAARTAVGCYPFVPLCLEQMTSMSLDTTPDLAAAVAAIQPLADAAGLRPPARVNLMGSLQLHNRPLFAQMTPGFNSSGSGYSTPSHSHTGTPTAAAAAMAAAQLHFGMPHKSLLDAVVRQGGLPRAGSDVSSNWSTQTYSDGGSAADLQGLLAASGAFAAVAAGSPLNPSPLLHASASEPLFAAAMAGLQLGMLQQQGAPSVPQMPWLGSSGGGFDALQGNYYAPQQQQQGSRLQNMTSPYVLPNALQQAYMMGHTTYLRH